MLEDAQLDRGHVIVEGAEADDHRRTRRHRATWRPIQKVTRVMTQPVPFNVVIGAWTCADYIDAQYMRRRVITKRYQVAWAGYAKGNVIAVLHTAGPIVHIPALVERDLGIVVARGKYRSLKTINAIAIRVLQPRSQTGRIPIS